MKIVATIEARMGSTRLPGKVLMPILGKPMLEHMIERVKKAKLVDEIIIATSTNERDVVLEELAKRVRVSCFRGSEDDVRGRVLQAAKTYKADHIVELWGDTPVIDPDIIDAAVKYYLSNDYDCVGTCLDKTFPFGISLLIFSTNTLDEVSRITNDPVDRENVSTYIYGHPEKYKIGNLPCPPELKRPELRLVVDELADFKLITEIFEHLYPTNPNFRTKEIIQLLDDNPGLLDLNRHIKQRVYATQK